MSRLAAQLNKYSPEWGLVAKAQYEGYTTSITDSYVQRRFVFNGHMKGWIAVYVEDKHYYDKEGMSRRKYFVRITSSDSRGDHKRNWTFRTNDLPERIHAKSEEILARVTQAVEEKIAEGKLCAEVKKAAKALFKDIPGWAFEYGGITHCRSEINLPNGQSIDVSSTYDLQAKTFKEHNISLTSDYDNSQMLDTLKAVLSVGKPRV